MERYKFLRDITPIQASSISDTDQIVLVDYVSENSKPFNKLLSLEELYDYWGLSDRIDDGALGVTIAQLENGKLKASQVPTYLATKSEVETYLNNLPKGQAGGLATLDNNGKLTPNQIPTSLVSNSDFLTHTLARNPHGTTADDVGAIASSRIGAANGVAPLNASSIIPEQYLSISRLDNIAIDYSSRGDNKFLRYNSGRNVYEFTTVQASSGNVGGINTASNLGSGVGLFISVNADTLQFRSLVSTSSAISLAIDGTGNLVNLTFNPANVNINDTANILSISKGGTGTSSKSWIDLTEAQSVNGIKTFLLSPVIPNATTSNQAAAFGQITAANVGNTNPIWNSNQLNSISVSTVAPTENQILTYSSGQWRAANLNISASSFNINDLSSILSIAKGGTGSSVKNFVDLSTTQTVDGEKTFVIAPKIPQGTLPEHAAALGQITAARVGNTNPVWNANQLNSISLSTTVPSENQILRFSEGQWRPANAETVSASNFNINDFNSTLSVAKGGTGSTTASGARTNLGAAASGINADITTLNSCTSAPVLIIDCGNY